MPGKTASFSAAVTRKVLTGYHARPQITSFCLRRADHPPANLATRTAVLRCKEGDQPCSAFDAADPGLVSLSTACTRINPRAVRQPGGAIALRRPRVRSSRCCAAKPGLERSLAPVAFGTQELRGAARRVHGLHASILAES
jgi:hypothetical protein